MEDYLLFGLVARECNINTLIVLRCTSKTIMDYVEDKELIADLVKLCGIKNVLSFNDLFAHNKHLLKVATDINDKIPYLLNMVSDDFNDRWVRYKCQCYHCSTERLDEMYTFICSGLGPVCSGHRYLDIRKEFEEGRITPYDIRVRCARERIAYSKNELMTQFPNFVESVCCLRLFGLIKLVTEE